MIRQFTYHFMRGSICRRTPASTPQIAIKMNSSSSAQSTERPAPVGPMNLPVPKLEQTLQKFLKSVRPFVSGEQFESTQAQVKKFLQQDGLKLQALLEERASKLPNWLEDWWLKTAYLQYRDPVVLFSSPGLVWPLTNFSNENERLQYTATLISAALEFNNMLEKRAVRQEVAGNSNLDMEQYYRVFGTTRIPLCGEDALVYQDSINRPTNIILMINNHAFSLDVLDVERRPLSPSLILKQLEAAVRDAVVTGPPVGLLTTERRDNWARAYTLLSKNVENVKSLNEIDRALFVVCLDSPLPSASKSYNRQSRTSALLLHGGGYKNGNAANRWYDKTIQFVVGAGSDGTGIAYEHSPAEGGPIGVLADFVIDRLSKGTAVPGGASSFPPPRRLPFVLPAILDSTVNTAISHIDHLAADLDIYGFKFSDFGKNEIKKFKTSPDSFVQIAIQLAFYKVHGKPAAQYESGSLRRFTGGRTDVIRTCSQETLEFCRSSGATRGDSLRAALSSHKQLANDAVTGQGIDRHLLGLKLIAKENNLPLPQLFSDPAYLASSYFQLSTSNVGARSDAFMVYAPLVSDGYACCYNIRDDDINMGTSAWRSNPYTDVTKFQAALVQALREMRDVLSSTIIKSKL